MASAEAVAKGPKGTEEDPSAPKKVGEFVRPRSNFRQRISQDGSTPFPATAGRYHLYVSNNCPWSSRCRLVRALLGLEKSISLDVLYFRRDPEHGWQFNPAESGCSPDSVLGKTYLRDVYLAADPDTKEKSVPVLWDKLQGTIVSNESADIVRMLNEAFRAPGRLDLYPEALRDEIDALNAWIYPEVNNGAYKAGFASSQEAYETAYDTYFSALDRLDRMLDTKRYLCSNTQITEADLRLFCTLVRHDHCYYVRFKLNKKMLRDYKNLGDYTRDIFQLPGVANNTSISHIKNGYFGRTPNFIIPAGPDYSLYEPHNRASRFAS